MFLYNTDCERDIYMPCFKSLMSKLKMLFVGFNQTATLLSFQDVLLGEYYAKIDINSMLYIKSA